ncbi:MAG: hypothetical protein ACOC1X_00635, partial [Promethearchaeota archaeon]
MSTVLEPAISEDQLEEYKEDSWASPFVTITEGIFIPLEFIIDGTVKLASGIGSMFSSILGLSETYEHNTYLRLNESGDEDIDGEYSPISYEEGSDIREWENREGTDSFTKIDLSTSEVEVSYKNWLGFRIVIYEGNYTEGEDTVDLERTTSGEDYGVNSEAEISGFEDLDTEGDYSDDTKGFIKTLREEVSDRVGVLGAIPSVIGLPLMLVLILAIIVGIIKLFPTT